MANMRRLAREKREAKKKEAKVEEKKQKIMETTPEESKVEEKPVEKKEDDFGNWLKNMDRYASMQLAYQKEERRKQELAAKREKELEAKYFKKFQTQQAQARQAKQAKQVKTKKPPTPAPLGNQQDFGIYSKYF